MGHIFISYSHKDKKYVHKLQEVLQIEGFEVWIDDRIDYGTRWPKIIQDKLDSCDAFIVVVSENSYESDWVQNEVARAKRKGKPFFPLLFSGDPWLAVEATQYVDITDKSLPAEKFYKRLASVTQRNKKEFPSALPQNPKPTKISIRPRTILGAIGFLLVTVIVFWGVPRLINFIGQLQFPNPIPTLKPEASFTLSETPTLAITTETPTVKPVITKTPNVSKTFAPELGIGSTQVSTIDGMIIDYVPQGIFTMGTDANSLLAECNKEGRKCEIIANTITIDQMYVSRSVFAEFGDEVPQHKVYLDAFWIDHTEVTNAMYALCVQKDRCLPPQKISSQKFGHCYGNPQYDNYPVVYITWEDAMTYCKWAGRRLPTETEWEKAARGTDGRIYPWGNETTSSSLANFSIYTNDVNSHPRSASPYGALDMVGNAWEWVSDWYSSNYYVNSPLNNPQGPPSGTERVLRGGLEFSWSESHRNWNHRLMNRLHYIPTGGYDRVGFRCARPANP